MNNKSDQPRSLLRRLLKKADEQSSVPPSLGDRPSAPAVQQTGASPASAVPARPAEAPSITPSATSPVASSTAKPVRSPGESSPVRPAPPQIDKPPDPLVPKRTQTISIPTKINGIEERLQAEEALEALRQKTAQAANEFAEGKVNRAQFMAMYAHYNEQRVIIERLLARDPGSQAWQQVVRPGHTTFLRQHFEARPLAYAIYDHNTTDPAKPLMRQGMAPLSAEIVQPILQAMDVMRHKADTGLLNSPPSEKLQNPAMSAVRKSLDQGRWLIIVPGRYTTSITLFSLEPSAQQFTAIQDMHRDFERANRTMLERGIRAQEQLVFPQRALFEKPKEG